MQRIRITSRCWIQWNTFVCERKVLMTRAEQRGVFCNFRQLARMSSVCMCACMRARARARARARVFVPVCVKDDVCE